MAKSKRRLAALTLAFGILPTHLAIPAFAGPIPETDDLNLTSSELDDPPDSSDEVPPNDPPDEELFPPLYIKAVNPGYNIDGVSNTSEFIELTNSTEDPLSLAGFTLVYNNGKTDYTLYEFPSNSFLNPGSLLLRLVKSPEVKNAEGPLAVANAVYTKELALSGSLRIMQTLEESTAELKDSADDSPPESTAEIIDSVCWTGKTGCLPAFKSKSPTVLVRNSEIGEFEHLEEYEPNFETDIYWFEEPEKSEENPEDLINTESQKELEPAPTKTCAEGYFLNPDTNRCNKIKETTVKTCEDGYYLNPETNRCKKLPVEKELTPCKEGYERNPETNRCRKIVDDAEDELVPCAEGYERNPETNRCRKIKTNDGADYALVPVVGVTEKKDFVALGALGATAILGTIYALFQFRHELAHFLKRLLAKFRK